MITAVVGANVKIVGGTWACTLEPAPDEVLLLVSPSVGYQQPRTYSGIVVEVRARLRRLERFEKNVSRRDQCFIVESHVKKGSKYTRSLFHISVGDLHRNEMTFESWICTWREAQCC